MDKFKSFNLNQHFLVKLTEEGFKVLSESTRLPSFMNVENDNCLDIEELKKQVDKNGYYKFQAYNFISVFGKNRIWNVII